jgi:hypothetical protein
MAMTLKTHWERGNTRGIELCPLLANLDGLLKYLDDL